MLTATGTANTAFANSNLTFDGSTLVVNAVENMCNNTISNVNTVNMSYTAPFAPTAVGNCVLWLDGSDTATMTLSNTSNITAWRDKSSQNYLASNFGVPTYAANIQNSRGVVSLGAAGRGFSIPSFVLSPQMSVFMVQYPFNAANGPPIEHSSNSALFPGFLVESGISNFLIRTSIPAPAGLAFTQTGTGLVANWTAYSGATNYTYTVYSNSIYATPGTAVAGATGSVGTNTFTFSSPVSGTYYYFTLNVTTSVGTSQLASSGIVQYITISTTPPVITNYTTTTTVSGTPYYYFKAAGSTVSTVITNSGGYLFNIFVLAGGGGGGNYGGGGGGAGGLVQVSSYLQSGTYTAIVGNGGNASSGLFSSGTSGSNTVFSNATTALATAIGGGYGGNGGGAGSNGANGGSGGGGGSSEQNTISIGGSPTSGQGYAGGAARGAGAGGGGVGGAGVASTVTNQGTAGGLGITYSDGIQYGGGGAGASQGSATLVVGLYGGGSGQATSGAATKGSNNTGGGGGGNWNGTSDNSGGSGIIVLSASPSLQPAPTNPTLAIATGTGTLAWTAVTGATSYLWTLYNNGSNTSTYTGTQVAGSNGTTTAPTVSTTVANLVLGSNYYYTVSASNASGVSPVAASPIVKYLPNPYNLTLAVTSSNATLTWSAVGDSPTFTYTLFQTTALSSGGSLSTVSGPTTTGVSNATVTFTSVNSNYYYYTINETTPGFGGVSPTYTSPVVQYIASSPPTITNYTNTATVSGTPYYYFKTVGSTSFAITNTGGTTINALVIAGGGGGGSHGGAGGGAGGVVLLSSSLTSGTYTAYVGGGGAGGNSSTRGTNGTNSILSNASTALATAIGGGGGGGGLPTSLTGLTGGSGGGGGGQGGNTNIAGGSGTGTQGKAGGTSYTPDSTAAGGGGGGYGSVGSNGTSVNTATGGAGGIGLLYTDGNQYAGGGGGSAWFAGAAGSYGGGNGEGSGLNNGTPATANTGGGGGGYYYQPQANPSGGSGIIVLSYVPTPSAPTNPAIAIVSGTATMTWTAAAGATSNAWVLYRSASSNYAGTSNASGATAGATATAAASGLTTGYYWYFTVSTSNGPSSISAAAVSSIVSY